MSKRDQLYKRAVARTNAVGVMMLLITLWQYALPAAFLGVLRLCGADTAAAFWSLPTARYLCLYLLMYLLMMGVPLWVCHTFLKPKTAKAPASPPLSSERRLFLIAFGVVLCVLANIFTTFFNDLLNNIGLPTPTLPSMGDGSFAILLFDLLVFAIVPAVMEELLMRRVVLETLRPLGTVTSIALSALLFGLLHGNLLQTPYACLMGLVLGWLYLYTSSLRTCIAVHMLSNTAAVTMNYLRLYYDSATASLWGLVILIVIFMSGGVACMWLWRHPLSHTSHPPATAASKRALLNAPLLWLSLAVLLTLLILRTV